ncbi:MAG: hypothetical protein ACYCS9_04530 [Candidatus Dormibacteria bacterium]
MIGAGNFSGYAAASRANRLEEYRQDHYGMADRGDGGPKRRLMAAPRALADGGDAARTAWEIADAGTAADAAAYYVPELGGWHWAAVVGPDERDGAGSGAVALVIGPDGARTAERCPDYSAAFGEIARYVVESATDTREIVTPAEFAAMLVGPEAQPVAVSECVAAPEPERVPLPWLPAEPVAAEIPTWQPNPDLLAGLLPEPAMPAEPVAVAAESEPEPVAVARPNRLGRWARLRGWVVRQLDELVTSALEIRPQLVRLEFAPEVDRNWRRSPNARR